MENNNANGEFKYTYSAKEQDEIKRIREKYTDERDEKESKLDRLVSLDERATRRAQTASIVLGIIGTLLLGSGMSLAMTELAVILGKYSHLSMLIGILIGVTGIVIIALAYPVYNVSLKRERKKIASEIIMLSDELMK